MIINAKNIRNQTSNITLAQITKFSKKKYDYVIIFGVLHLNLNWRKILLMQKKFQKVII